MQTGFLISPDQCRAARALVNWTQAELATQAGVIRANVVLFEGGQTASTMMRRRLQTALERAGITFVRPDAAGGPGVVMNASPGARRRQPYMFDADFYESQARLIAQVARHPAYVDLREGFLSLSRDYYFQARCLSSTGGIPKGADR